MRRLRSVALGAVAAAVICYVVGLGIFAVASTRPRIESQPVTAEAANETLRQLGIAREYQFNHGFVATPQGRMHYAEAGEGDAVLCLHGNPTWSFLYREFLSGLSAHARVVAPDLIGFGLSEKPRDPESYSVQAHIANVTALVDALDLRRITFVLQDWGGPIGLGVALARPERVRALVIMNTIGFVSEPQKDGARIPLPLRLLRVPLLGEQLVQGLGLFHRLGIPGGIARPERRSERVLNAYLEVQGSWEERAGTLAFPRLIPTGPEHPAFPVFRQAEIFLSGFKGPALLIWGMRDPVFGPEILEEWRQRLPRADVLTLEEAGHFLQEDAAELIVPRVREFLREAAPAAG